MDSLPAGRLAACAGMTEKKRVSKKSYAYLIL